MIPTTWRRGATLLVVLLGLPLIALAQIQRSRIYSRPEIPSEEVLRRLNLHLAWRVAVPVDGRRDTLVRVDLDGNDMFVLLRSGTVLRLDAETGKIHWRSQIGRPYTVLPYLTHNMRSVYVLANAHLYSLDRETGAHKWEHVLPGGITAGPAVDDEQIYIPTAAGRLTAFYLPFVLGAGDQQNLSPGELGERRKSLVYNMSGGENQFEPKPVWFSQTDLNIPFRPLQTLEEVAILSSSGEGVIFSKSARDGGVSNELVRFSVEGKVSFSPVEYGDMAYIGADDATLYALNLKNGKLRWRHTTGTPVTRSPVAIEKDVYVTSSREGLARIDRDSGDAMWRVPLGQGLSDANPGADRFLAANDRLVYASDHSGRLVILDRRYGTRLSMFDTSAFRVPVVNNVTDRLYLAANDGMIVCLHDRDQKAPVRHRRPLEELTSPLRRRLNQPINSPGALNKISLREALAKLRSDYKVHFVIALQAFKAAKQPDPTEVLVAMPRSENRPLKEHLKLLLEQVPATFDIADQTVVVVPARPGEKAKPAPVDDGGGVKAKPKPKDKEKPKEKDKDDDM